MIAESIVSRYGLDAQSLVHCRGRDFSPCHDVQNSKAYRSSDPMGMSGLLVGWVRGENTVKLLQRASELGK